MAAGTQAAQPTPGDVDPAPPTAQKQQTPSPENQALNTFNKDPSSTSSDATKVREAIDAVRTDNSLPEELRTRCQEVLTTTLKDIECRDEDKQLITQLVKAAESSEQRKKDVEKLDEKPIDISLGGVTPKSDAAKIEELLRTLDKDLLTTTTQANKIQQQLNARRTETKSLPVQIAQAEEELSSVAPPEETAESNPVLTAALKPATVAKREKLETSLELFRQKIVTYDAEASVLPLEKAALDKRGVALSKTITDVTAWVTRRHTDEIKTQITNYRSTINETNFNDQNEYEHFIELLDLWPVTVASAESWSTQLLSLKEKTNSLRDDLQETTSLVESDRATGSGLSRTAGYLLRRKHVMLNRERAMLNQSYSQGNAVDNAQDILGDIDTELDKVEQLLNSANDPEQTKALAARKKILRAMSLDIDRCLVDILIPSGVTLDQLSHIIDEYQHLIDTNLLWVRSDKPVRLSDVTRLLTVARQFEAQPIAMVATSFWTNVKARPYLATAFVLLTLARALSYRLFIRRITALSGSLSGSNAMRLWPTIQGVCYTICAALPVWLALTAISWFLGHYAEPESTESSFANAVGVTALVFLPLEILRQLIRPHGIATAHFGWPQLVIKPLGQAVRRFGWIGLALVFLATFLLLERYVHREISALARIVFATLMIFIASTLWKLLGLKSGVVAGLEATQPDSLLAKLT